MVYAIITARKRSLRRLCFYRCVCHSVHMGGGGAIPACITGGIPACLAAGLWGEGVVSEHALQVSRPTPKGKFRGIWLGGSPGPHPRGKLRGIWSRPTAKGEIEGDLVQAHSQGGSLGGSGWGVPAPRGCLGGGAYFRDSYCCGQYASYWNAFLYGILLQSCPRLFRST